MSSDIRNAKIKRVDVSINTCATPVLTVDFEGAGWGVGYPAYSGFLAEHINGLLLVAGATTLTGAFGKPVRVVLDGGAFKEVRHFMDDKLVLNPREMSARLKDLTAPDADDHTL